MAARRGRARGGRRHERERLWAALVDFGVLAVDREEGLGAVELCLAARAFGAHLASTPFLGSAALRFASSRADDARALADSATTRSRRAARARPRLGGRGALTSARRVDGRKVAVEHADEVDRFAVVASAGGAPALALVAAAAGGIDVEPQASLDPACRCTPSPSTAPSPRAPPTASSPAAVLPRLTASARCWRPPRPSARPSRMLEDARAYAAQRRQFGRTIGC